MFKVDPILDAAKPDGREGKLQSSSGIRFNDRLVAKYLIITDLSNFFKKTLLYVKVFFCRFNNLFEKLRAVLNIHKNFLLTTNVYNYLPT